MGQICRLHNYMIWLKPNFVTQNIAKCDNYYEFLFRVILRTSMYMSITWGNFLKKYSFLDPTFKEKKPLLPGYGLGVYIFMISPLVLLVQEDKIPHSDKLRLLPAVFGVRTWAKQCTLVFVTLVEQQITFPVLKNTFSLLSDISITSLCKLGKLVMKKSTDKNIPLLLLIDSTNVYWTLTTCQILL